MTVSAASLPANPAPKRYHPALVVLHWLIAVLIIAAALSAGDGGEREGFRSGLSTIAGLPPLSLHIILGGLVFVLLIVRLVIRWRSHLPAWATTGSGFLDKVGVATHWGLYFFSFAVLITGFVLALQTNRLSRLLTPTTSTRSFTPGQSQPGALPPSGGFQPRQSSPSGQFRFGEGESGGFEGRLSRSGGFFLGAFHGLSWIMLLLLIILHVGAALYHQIVRRDGLLGRMWFGPRYA